jgi:hypothetical protein
MRSGDETVLPLEDAIEAIRIADENLIAILGVETFSGYDLSATRNGKISSLLTTMPRRVS